MKYGGARLLQSRPSLMPTLVPHALSVSSQNRALAYPSCRHESRSRVGRAVTRVWLQGEGNNASVRYM
jgi:hypothetical protein